MKISSWVTLAVVTLVTGAAAVLAYFFLRSSGATPPLLAGGGQARKDALAKDPAEPLVREVAGYKIDGWVDEAGFVHPLSRADIAWGRLNIDTPYQNAHPFAPGSYVMREDGVKVKIVDARGTAIG